MANIAFGTQKISAQNLQNIQALKEAITSGVTLIESSSEYFDGTSNKAIAIAFRELDSSLIENVEIVNKFTYTEKEGINKQLKQVLDELGISTLDCFVVHQIEYYLIDALSKKVSKDERLDGMNKIIYKVFFELEKAVQEGKIKSYGISSEHFAHPQTLETFLPYEDLIAVADIAAKEVGNKKNSLSTIELPINILEKEGLNCASWAKENGLRVLVTRPLTAQIQGKFYRLASYDESSEYYHHLNELLELCDNEILQPLYNFIDELDNSKHKFGWIEDYEQFLYHQAMPHIASALKNLDEKHQETMINYIDMYLAEYKKMVAYECSVKTRNELQMFFKECLTTLQKCAVDFLQKQENIDFIVVGMRKPLYVSELVG